MTGQITYVKQAAAKTAKFTAGCGSGYGFIKDENGQDRMFTHANVVDTPFDDLRKGLNVEFIPYVDEDREPGKNLRAKDVKVVA